MALGAVNSVTCILERILQHQHVVFHDTQRQHIESLLQEVILLRDSLENYSRESSEKLTFLESQIVKAARKVIDLIRSCIGDPLMMYRKSNYTLTFSYPCLNGVKREIDFIKRLVEKIEEEFHCLQNQPPRIPPAAGSSMPASPKGKLTVVGVVEDLMEIKTWLVTYSSTELKTISIVGMGGIGKTTLAKQVYNDSSILYHFHTRAWVTVSQSYNLRQILLDLFHSMILDDQMYELRSTEKLKEFLYKSLKGRRYLIVMDDVWDTILWDALKRIFPDDQNASRVLLTTRLENVATYTNSCPHHMRFLNEEASWKLLCNKVFERDYCPDQELEEIGKKISQNCRGLPLAVAVIGGLLSKAPRTQHYWTSIAKNTSLILFTEDGQCLQILSLSYAHLPRHLKKCFLYIGIFPEDYPIRVSNLMKLWVAEGFVEPMEPKSLEDLAYEYLLNLVDRSLILNDKLSYNGKIKTCKIHDIVRDFCTREAKNEMFYHIVDRTLYDIPLGNSLYCLSIHPNEENIFPYDKKKLSSLRVRSFFGFDFTYVMSAARQDLNPLFLRVLEGMPFYPSETMFFELRYLNYAHAPLDGLFYSSFSALFPNLETLIVGSFPKEEVIIWDLPKLRYAKFQLSASLSDPMEAESSFPVLENLQKLSGVSKLKFSEAFLAKIPNLKKLGIIYFLESDWKYYCLNNVVHLQKLESLNVELSGECPPSFLHNITIPASLKKLTLLGGHHPWKDMVLIGMLPNLEVLKLKWQSFVGQEWEPTENQFLNLKCLMLYDLELQQWTADSVHFPTLRCLKIRSCNNLKEIPSGIGDVPTLLSIKLHRCANSLIASAKRIQQEQLDLGYDGLQLHIK